MGKNRTWTNDILWVGVAKDTSSAPFRAYVPDPHEPGS